MDFRQLQYMLKVAEEKSFSKAAQKLYISQPSLSQYIQKLENQLGVQLFDRSTTPLNLTFAGELYYETAKQILDLKNQLYQQMEDITNFKRGRLVIGVSPFRSASIIPKILPHFRKKFPDIEIILREGTSSELEHYALKGVTDLSIMIYPTNDELMTTERICEEELLLAIPREYDLSGINIIKDTSTNRQSINLSDLKDFPFILLLPNQKLHKLALDLCSLFKFKPNVVLETKSIETAHALVSTGMGITFIPDTLTWFKRTESMPLYYHIEGADTKRTLLISYKKGKYMSRAAIEFIELAKQILSK